MTPHGAQAAQPPAGRLKTWVRTTTVAASATWGGDRRRFLWPGRAAAASRLDGSSLRRKERWCQEEPALHPRAGRLRSRLQGGGLIRGVSQQALAHVSSMAGPLRTRVPSWPQPSFLPSPGLDPAHGVLLGRGAPGHAADRGWGFSLIFSTSCVRRAAGNSGSWCQTGTADPRGSPAALGTWRRAASELCPPGVLAPAGQWVWGSGGAVAQWLNFPPVKQPTASSSPWGCLGLRHRGGGLHPCPWKPWADGRET